MKVKASKVVEMMGIKIGEPFLCEGREGVFIIHHINDELGAFTLSKDGGDHWMENVGCFVGPRIEPVIEPRVSNKDIRLAKILDPKYKWFIRTRLYSALTTDKPVKNQNGSWILGIDPIMLGDLKLFAHVNEYDGNLLSLDLVRKLNHDDPARDALPF